MPKEIYINPKFSKKDGWTSFESDPHLTTTKRAIHLRCLPCIKRFYQQLIDGQDPIDLGSAWDCWKVVVLMETDEECLDLLEAYRDRFLPGDYIRGRFGGREGSAKKAIIVSAETEAQKDRFMEQMTRCLSDLGLERALFFSKGCADPYEKILGPWQDWQPRTPVKHLENIDGVVSGLERLLKRY